MARREIEAMYFKVEIPISTLEEVRAVYKCKRPTLFSRIVGNTLLEGVEITSLKVDGREQFVDPPLDLSFFAADNGRPRLLYFATAVREVVVTARVSRKVPAKILLIGPPYNASHRFYKLANEGESDKYTILIEGAEGRGL